MCVDSLQDHPGSLPEPHVLVGIIVLNYHHPAETIACIRSLLGVEGAETRILWIENDTDTTGPHLNADLESAGFPWVFIESRDPLPPAGTVGVIRIGENLGYAGGNNVGLRYLHQNGIPFAWILNNDTELKKGNSSELIKIAKQKPEIGVLGTRIETEDRFYYGGVLDPKVLSITLCRQAEQLENCPEAFVSGCSLFFRMDVAAKIGFLPEHYFLYFEDPAFTIEMRRRGMMITATDEVVVNHLESLSTGRRSMLMEYYIRRNRWFFIETYYPSQLSFNRWRLFYDLQKYLLRFRLRRAWVEWLAFSDFNRHLMGPTKRNLSRFRST